MSVNNARPPLVLSLDWDFDAEQKTDPVVPRHRVARGSIPPAVDSDDEITSIVRRPIRR